MREPINDGESVSINLEDRAISSSSPRNPVFIYDTSYNLNRTEIWKSCPKVVQKLPSYGML